MKTNFNKIFLILCFLLGFKIYIKISKEMNYKKCKTLLKDTTGLNCNDICEDTISLNKKNLEIVVYKTFTDSLTGKIDTPNAELAIKQVYLESGHLKSELCIENNNLIGMKHPRVRETKSLGEKNGHAYYKNWVQCIKDIYLWRKANNCLGLTEKKLLSIIGRKYAEDPKYITKLVNISTLRDERT